MAGLIAIEWNQAGFWPPELFGLRGDKIAVTQVVSYLT